MEPEKTARGRGRPAKAEAERRRHIQTFRCNDALRDALQKSADANQRSISEEVEFRLQMDLAAEEEQESNRRDPNHGVAAELESRIRKGMGLLRGYVGDDWPNDVAANAAMFYVVFAIADDYFKPKPEKDWSKSEREAIDRTLKAADKVVDVVTWRDGVPDQIKDNKLMVAGLVGQSKMSAREVFAARQKLAARLAERDAEAGS